MPRTLPPNERLRAALIARGWNHSELASRLKVDSSAVSRWVGGKADPEPYCRWAFERMFGIPQIDWLTEEQRSIVDDALCLDRKAG